MARTTGPLAEIRRRVHRELQEILGPKLYHERSMEMLEKRVRETLQEVLGKEETPLTAADRTRITAEICDEILGHGPPDAIQLMIGSLRLGFSLPQALDSLVRESPEPVGAEFGRALAEHRLGADISDALERVGQRTRSEDIGRAVMAIRIQREVGGNLAEVLQTTVDTMRERARLRRHVRSLSAEGWLSAWVLIGLPIGLGAFMFVYRRA